MKKLLLITLYIIYSMPLAAQTNSDIILSEIMFNTKSGNNEFIELYNTSKTASYNLSDYKIIYSSSKADKIIPVLNDSILHPNSFTVILEGDYKIDSGIYENIIPPGTLLFKTVDNAFGTSGMANTSNRTIGFCNLQTVLRCLIGPDNDTLETYTYSANNSTNSSDEKIILNSDDSKANWKNSKVKFGTPGFRNSVTPFNYDLELATLTYYPEIPISGNDVKLQIGIINNGLKTANNFSVKLYNDTNSDSLSEEQELISSKNILTLLPKDSLTTDIVLKSVIHGSYNLIIKIDFAPDEKLSNNRKYFPLKVYRREHNYNDVVINEIMYAPYNGKPEWVELYNRSDSIINLKKWSILDNQHKQTITSQDLTIPSKTFIVISKDSSILNYYSIPSKIIITNLPSLNNSGDAIVIKDSLGILIDSLSYLPSWGGNSGKSLERINSNFSSTDNLNWTTSKSTEGGTPGKINSVTQKDFDLKLVNILFTPPHPFNGENVSIAVKIENIGISAADFSINLFP